MNKVPVKLVILGSCVVARGGRMMDVGLDLPGLVLLACLQLSRVSGC